MLLAVLQRSHRGLRVESAADYGLPRNAGDGAAKAVVHRVRHIHPLDGDAELPGIGKGKPVDRGGDRVRIGVVQH
jgi:hypothetical protein